MATLSIMERVRKVTSEYVIPNDGAKYNWKEYTGISMKSSQGLEALMYVSYLTSLL